MNEKKIIVALILAVCFIRIISVFFAQGWLNDEMTYMVTARGIVNDFSYSPAFLAPTFPFTLSFFYFIFGVSEAVSRAVPIIFGILGIIAVYYLGKRLYDEEIGLYSALFIAILPLHWFYSIRVMTDAVFVFLSAIFILLFFLSLKKEKLLIPTAVIGVLIFLIKYIGIIFLIFFLVYLLWKKRSVFKGKYFWISVVLGLIVISPWIFNNVSVFDHPFGAVFSQVDVNVPEVYHPFHIVYYILSSHIEFALFIPFVIFGIYYLARRPNEKNKFMFLFLIIGLIVLSLWTVERYRYLLPLMPVFAVITAFSFRRIREKWGEKILLIIVILLLLGNSFIVFSQFESYPKMEKYVNLESAGLFLKESCIGKNIYSNEPSYVHWYTGQKSLDPLTMYVSSDSCVLISKYIYPPFVFNYNETFMQFLEDNFEVIFESGEVKIYG